jgi:polysaccharide pyruvyl transferase WcaK-like protein
VRIGLIGWYGHRNAGDDRILLCLRRFFDGHELVVTTSFCDALERLGELNSCDFVMLGGGGLILRGTGRFANLIERLKPRFGCVGISVESRHTDNIRMIDVLKERAEFLLVRDARSRELLDCHFKTIVGPDLTFLYPYEVADPPEADVCGLNLRPWRFWPGEHNGSFDRIMRRINNRIPELVQFYPFARWDPLKAITLLRNHFGGFVALPLYLENGVENDRDVLSRFFPQVSRNFSDEEFNGCRYIVSMRLHGLIFACQKGIPFLSLSYQPKNEEFCSEMGIAEISVDIFEEASLLSALDRLTSDHAQLRLRLLDARADYQREITVIMKAIRNLVV